MPKFREQSGQSLVEFALVAPLLLLLLYGIIQFGLIFYGFITVEQAARMGVRSASLGSSISVIGQAIDAEISGIGMNPTATTTAYTPPGPFTSTTDRLVWDAYSASSGSNATVVVTVLYRFPIVIPIFGTTNIQLQQQFTMPQEDSATGQIGSASATSPFVFYGGA